jgi:hypothetical protein
MPGLPPLQLSSSAESRGGEALSPWYQGDQVVSYAGDARSGDRTAPAAMGSIAGAVGPSLAIPLAIAAAILIGALAWKRSL